MTKATRRESITVEIDGVSYTGERVIEGTMSFSQSITYKGVTERDGTHYKPHETTMMNGIAECILHQIIQQSRRDPAG
jgi:hypothetical protein